VSGSGFTRSIAIVALTAVAVLTTVSQVAAQVPVGDFYFFDRSDAEISRTSITTLAEESHVTGAGGLTWSCEDGERRLIVSSTYLGRSMRARVRWAFDGEEPGEPESWILRRTGMAVIAPAAAARQVVTSVNEVASGSALSTEPPLNPNHPSHSKNTPIVASGMLCPGIAFTAPSDAYLPNLGPSAITPMSAPQPPTECTNVDPAKS